MSAFEGKADTAWIPLIQQDDVVGSRASVGFASPSLTQAEISRSSIQQVPC
jgi:hypothetical protein